MAIRKRYPRRRVVAKRPRRKVYSTVKKTSGLKKMVRREIARNIENKTTQYLGTNYDILPSNSAGFDANIIPVAPSAGGFVQIQQSVAQNGRIGNRIKIKKLKIAGVMFPTPYSATTNLTPCPVQIKLTFFYDKEDGQAVPTPQGSGDYLQFGSGSLPLQNTLFDHSMPVNTDRYRVLTTRTYKLGYSQYLGTGTQPQSGNFSNNDFKLNTNFSVDLTKHCIKNVIYRDNGANPTSRGIYMMAQPVYANGVSMTAATIPARAQFMITCDYEDA